MGVEEMGPILSNHDHLKHFKLGVAFITHEGSPRKNREKELRAKVERVFSSVELVDITNWYSISWQPSFYKVKNREYLRSLAFRVRSGIEWHEGGIVRIMIQATLFELKSLLNGRSQLTLPQNYLYVAKVVTEKHVRSWVNALEDSVEALLVLEDDAILQENSVETLSQAIKFIKRQMPTYINLSKGNNLKDYKKEYSEDSQEAGWFKLRAADTAGAYLVNRNGLEVLARKYSEEPNTAVLAIDFMASDILIHNKKFEVYHTDSPPFLNGTLLGLFETQTGSVPQFGTE